ncbi:MAG: DNA repair protein RadA [Rudaea sp.]
MPKTRTKWVCQQCGYVSTKWLGRCPECQEWDSLVESIEERSTAAISSLATLAPRSAPQRLTEITTDSSQRVPVPMSELSRVLGGGIMPGSVVLISGDPGLGKSTLLIQLAAMQAMTMGTVLYVSGEESVQQIKMRAERLGLAPDSLYLLTETNLDEIIGHINQLQPRLIIVDSIQTVYLEELGSAAGSVSQVRECTARLLQIAKSAGIPVFIVGHVTKSGTIAGPRVLEHIVDTVLYLEGERFHTYRLLRSVKNRFGATSEVGVFEMTQDGMTEIDNPSAAFLAERAAHSSGNAIAVTMEGTRPLLVEVQALTSTTAYGLPRRTANGIDMGRLLLLSAALSKRVGLKLYNQDIFVNVVGGMKINEPAADLTVAVAIASSFKDRPVADDLAIIGEVGLSGELRTVSQIDRRLKEAGKLGFKRALVPHTLAGPKYKSNGIELVGAHNLSEALEIALVN